MSRVVSLTIFIFSGILLSSCANTKKAVYFQDIQNVQLNNPVLNQESHFQKNDILSISVSSANPEASLAFNTPNMPNGGLPTQANSTSGQSAGYLINADGNIQFPFLGAVKAEGLTPKQLTDDITNRILQKKLLVDPIISVRQLNFHVTVLGEVLRPAVINVPNEKINLLEAIGLAGDLTIFARRDNILLIREENGVKTIQRLNMNSSDILSSPYYYLKSGDIVYAEPNKTKIHSTSESRQVLPIVLSALSIVAIIATRIK